jgi:hypothetical protein
MSMVLKKRMDESVEGNCYCPPRSGKKHGRLLGDSLMDRSSRKPVSCVEGGGATIEFGEKDRKQ